MSYLLDTNVLSEVVRRSPDRKVMDWLNAKDFQIQGLEVINPWEG